VTTGSRLQRICAYLFVLVVCLSQITVAQEPDAIDEIVVMGGRPLTLLRHEVTQAEDVFYDRYNFLNEDDRYDMICKDETPIGTRIPVRVCKTRVIRDAERQATQDALMDYDRLSKKYTEEREKKFD